MAVEVRYPSRTNKVQARPFDFFYPQTCAVRLHPTVLRFLELDACQLLEHFAEVHPGAAREALAAVLNYQPRFFMWGGADLFRVTDAEGRRSMVLIEINSCPAGQKSLPLADPGRPLRGYQDLIERTFLPLLSRGGLPGGGLAVIHDRNLLEVRGYAATIAELTGEPVHLAASCDPAACPDFVFIDGVLHVRGPSGHWCPIRAALRYVTQRPWTRIPSRTTTAILNPLLACLAGGRNKLLAAKAFEGFNQAHRHVGLRILIPRTITDVSLEEVPVHVAQLGGQAAVKSPYSNAGQDVSIIARPEDLAVFMALPHCYDRFVVQELMAPASWVDHASAARMSPVPIALLDDERRFVADLRMMIGASPQGLRPVALHGRRARIPLSATLPLPYCAQAMLATNLSVRRGSGWDTEGDRLLVMDEASFPRLGLGLHDLVAAFFQSAMALVAIDQMAIALDDGTGALSLSEFASLNPDPALLCELAAAERAHASYGRAPGMTA